jgi:hypothetical protein
VFKTNECPLIITVVRDYTGKKSGTKRKGFTKIVFDLPKSVDESFQESLSAQLITHTTASWMQFYGALVLYKEKHGDCNVKFLYKTPEPECLNLGYWVDKQRQFKKKGSLDKELKK